MEIRSNYERWVLKSEGIDCRSFEGSFDLSARESRDIINHKSHLSLF